MKRFISVISIAFVIWLFQRSTSTSDKQESSQDTSARNKSVLRAQGSSQDQAAEKKEASHPQASSDLDEMVGELHQKTNLIDRHFLMTDIVDQAYKNRSNPESAAILRKVAEMHIFEFPEIKPALTKEMKGILPRVTTFQKYATLLAENEEYDKAIEVCEKAINEGLQDGTKTGFEGRIERIKKKMPE